MDKKGKKKETKKTAKPELSQTLSVCHGDPKYKWITLNKIVSPNGERIETTSVMQLSRGVIAFRVSVRELTKPAPGLPDHNVWTNAEAVHDIQGVNVKIRKGGYAEITRA